VRGRALPARKSSGTLTPSMGHRLDSTSSASSAALSRFGYAYAYPFAWRFS